MEISELKLFLAVAESGTISGAASELHTVQSNVSARLRALERRFGIPLFNRHARGVTLTSSGEIFLPYAERIVRLMQEGMRVVADVENPAGTLSLGAMETTAGWRLPELLAGFAEDCPAVDISLRTGPTEELLREVLDYRLDGAFVSGPVDSPDLLSSSVYVEELVLVSRRRLPDIDPGTPIGIDAARRSLDRRTKFLVFRHGCSYRRRLIDFLGDQGGQPMPIMEFGSLEGILGCVAAGMGLTLLPANVVHSSSLRSHVHIQPIEPELARAETVFVRRADVPLGPAMKRFLDHLRRAATQALTPLRTTA